MTNECLWDDASFLREYVFENLFQMRRRVGQALGRYHVRHLVRTLVDRARLHRKKIPKVKVSSVEEQSTFGYAVTY